MPVYIYQRRDWPVFTWQQDTIGSKLASVRHRQGRLLGRMEGVGFFLQAEVNLHNLSLDVLRSSEIEGEILNPDQVRSSIARKLGMDIAGLSTVDRHVEGIVQMMLDATQNNTAPLTDKRLFGWHAALFPTGHSGMQKISAGHYRVNRNEDPMQVVSGPMGRETVHFQAPDADRVPAGTANFLSWFNAENDLDSVIKAAVAHLWFVTLHPFDDGNGRMARAITDLQLSRSDQSAQRFYSMSSQIGKERNEYYNVLESTQKGSLDITDWLDWFLDCLDRAISHSDENRSLVLKKSQFWTRHTATGLNERQMKMLNRLLDGFEGNLTSSKWAKITKSSQDTAIRDINDLVQQGILKKESAGGRSTHYHLISSPAD
jgi:Fic family protein